MAIELVVAHTQSMICMGIVAMLRIDRQLAAIAETTDGVQAVGLCRWLRPQLARRDLHLEGSSELAVVHSRSGAYVHE